MTNGILTYLKEHRMAKTDLEFCSNADEDFFEEVHSPTDNSEDSVDVKVTPITLHKKRKNNNDSPPNNKFSGPLKKRMCMKIKSEKNEPHPFRPWSPTPQKSAPQCQSASPFFAIPVVPYCMEPSRVPTQTHAYFRPPSPPKIEIQEEPVDLIKKEKVPKVEPCQVPPMVPEVVSPKVVKIELFSDVNKSNKCDMVPVVPRVPLHPHVGTMGSLETEKMLLASAKAFPMLGSASGSIGGGSIASGSGDHMSKREQRNYKNMTRERRIEANARERTRVHTISAAFDTLRKSIPSYSNNQKLSKLSVLRIACSYIMTLSNIVDSPDPETDQKTTESVELITKTIQKEGKLRKKKDDSD